MTITAAVAFASGCGGGGGEADSGAVEPPRRGGVVVIEMNDEMRFVPENALVAPGDTIEWVNVGEIPHTATASPGAAAVPDHVALPDGAAPWDSGEIGPGERFRTVVEVEGEYAYVCTLHEALGMVGRLVVRPDS